MKNLILLMMLAIGIASYGQENFYDLSATTIDGETFDFSQLKGKKVLIVNTASKCGLTPQYEDLEKLHQQYAGEDFIILGFPANNFNKQEPGSNDEIKSFCSLNYGVSFQMMSKISVKGDDIHPIYQWLTEKEKNGLKDSSVKWNFQKYAIDADGKLVSVFSPRTKPLSEEIIQWVSN